MELADVEPVASLLRELAQEFSVGELSQEARRKFLEENSADAIRRFVSSGFRYHVAEMNGVLVGFVGVRDNKHLYHLFVAKTLQRKGIGHMLWSLAKEECEMAGHRGAITVNSSNNAMPVYERWGFCRDGPAKHSNGVTYNPMKLEPAE